MKAGCREERESQQHLGWKYINFRRVGKHNNVVFVVVDLSKWMVRSGE